MYSNTSSSPKWQSSRSLWRRNSSWQNTFNVFSLHKCILFAWLLFSKCILCIGEKVRLKLQRIAYTVSILDTSDTSKICPLKNAKRNIPVYPYIILSIYGPFLWLQWCKKQKTPFDRLFRPRGRNRIVRFSLTQGFPIRKMIVLTNTKLYSKLYCISLYSVESMKRTQSSLFSDTPFYLHTWMYWHKDTFIGYWPIHFVL